MKYIASGSGCYSVIVLWLSMVCAIWLVLWSAVTCYGISGGIPLTSAHSVHMKVSKGAKIDTIKYHT